MTREEAHKINELYRQLDTLTAENAALQATVENKHDHKDLVLLLQSVDKKLDTLLKSKEVTK